MHIFWFFIVSTLYLFVVDTAPSPYIVGTKAEQMCTKYGEVVQITTNFTVSGGSDSSTVSHKMEECPFKFVPLIVGGEAALPKEFPHMVLVGYRDYPIVWGCGGSLISDRWILSAAHCTATLKTGLLVKWALLGDLIVNSDDDALSSKPTIMQIIKRINHPNYERKTKYNDISLYMLEKSVEFNAFIRPLCLNTQKEIANVNATATGWGKTIANDTEEKSVSAALQKVTLDLVKKPNLCKQKYERASSKILKTIPQGITDENMLCAWTESKDTCQGDSGGPLQIVLQKPYCMYSLIGVTSFGEETCATSRPGVYTRVSHYIEWIEKIVWP